MNNLPYFWNIEDNELRGDPNDSVSEIVRGKKISFSIQDEGANNKHFVLNGKFTLRFHPANAENINLFCMYAMRPAFGSYPIPEKNFRFGDFALVFLEPQTFVDRIELFINKNKILGKADLVEYVDDNHIGKVGPFRKSKSFKYQSEWRLVCIDGPDREMILQIGNLKKISTIVKAEEINDLIKVEN